MRVMLLGVVFSKGLGAKNSVGVYNDIDTIAREASGASVSYVKRY